MEYQDYLYIFYGGAVMAGIMLIVSVLLFIFLKIPTVIGDLTGSNARKAIADIRSQNENSGTKVYKTSHVNRERGTVVLDMGEKTIVLNRQQEAQPVFNVEYEITFIHTNEVII